MIQDYTGDVTILPVPNIWQVTKTISNPSFDDIERYKIEGARRTYPKLSMIENILKIELALDNNYTKLKQKLKKNQKYISEKKYTLDEENYDFELEAKPEEKKQIKINIPQSPISLEFDSISENEDLDEISEKHNGVIFYNNENSNNPYILNFYDSKNILSNKNDLNEKYGIKYNFDLSGNNQTKKYESDNNLQRNRFESSNLNKKISKPNVSELN